MTWTSPALQLKIRAKLADGFLPKEFLLRVFGKLGAGQVCDACESIIPASELEIEGNLSKGGTVRLHVRCFTIWQKEREAEDRRSAGPNHRAHPDRTQSAQDC